MASAQFSNIFDTIPSGKQLKSLTREEVAKHNKEGDLWCIIDTAVYDLSKFVDMHPGGASVLLDKKVAGKDATKAFFGLHRSEVLKKYGRLVHCHDLQSFPLVQGGLWI
jgi:cytochrome b involved in lipid metabolism